MPTVREEKLVDNPVKIPGSAVDPSGNDVAAPTAQLLTSLSLLPTSSDLEDAKKQTAVATAVFGTPDSLAVIESSATAIAKWWAGGLGAAAAVALPAVRTFLTGQPEANQRVLFIAVGIAVAASVLSIGYIVASDVRGRAAASVATIEARAKVADAMLRLAESAYAPSSSAPDQFVALPAPLPVRWTTQSGTNETGWRALAFSQAGSDTKFLIVKGAGRELASGTELEFE